MNWGFLGVWSLLPLLCYGQLGEKFDGNSLVESCGKKVPSDFASETETNVGEFPWIALVGYEDTELNRMFYACTGSLISRRYVLTAALCVVPGHILRSNSQISHVRLGEHNIEDDLDCYRTQFDSCLLKTRSVEVPIANAVAHPNYNTLGFLSHNIALIELQEDVDFETFNGFISPICLPPSDLSEDVTLKDTLGEVAGWDFGSGHPNSVLMKETMPMANPEECQNQFIGFHHGMQICMKSSAIRRRCTGDSGSPLSVRAPGNSDVTLIGILSHGPLPCGFSDSPSIFTSVSYYRDWIDSNTAF